MAPPHDKVVFKFELMPSAAYHASGFETLPSERTLRDYNTTYIKRVPGADADADADVV